MACIADASDSPRPSKTYECPICMKYLLPPIYQCYNGHMLCEKCELKIKTCPICRDDLPQGKKIRNKILEEIVMKLTFCCRNYEEGCTVSLKYNEFAGHTWKCNFMKLPICLRLGIKCDSKQTMGSILDHLKTTHGLLGFNFDDVSHNNVSFPIVEVNQSAVSSQLDVEGDGIRNNLNPPGPTWMPVYFIFQGQLLFLTTNYDRGSQRFTWDISFLGKEPKKFLAKIKLMSRHSGISFFEWTGAVAELKNEDKIPENERQNSNLMKFNTLLKDLKLLSTPQLSGAVDVGSKQGKIEAQLSTDNEIKWRLQLAFGYAQQEDDSDFNWHDKLTAAVLKV